MLMRRKSARELAAMRAACATLDAAVAAMDEAHHSGAGATAVVLAGEHAAHRRGAQDVRTLFSLDGGRDLAAVRTSGRAVRSIRCRSMSRFGSSAIGRRDLSSLTDAPNPCADAAARRPALRHRDDPAGPAMRRGADAAIIGGHCAPASASHDGASQGNSIGLALEEHPLITAESDDTFEAGEVYSLRVGLSDERDYAIVVGDGRGAADTAATLLWSSPEGADMTALEQLGSYVASSAPDRIRRRARAGRAPLIDTVGAWIASAPTAEGSSLLRFRAAMRAGRRTGTRRARSRDPLRAGAAERDRRYPSALDDHAGRDRHSRRAHAGSGDAAARRTT